MIHTYEERCFKELRKKITYYKVVYKVPKGRDNGLIANALESGQGGSRTCVYKGVPTN